MARKSPSRPARKLKKNAKFDEQYILSEANLSAMRDGPKRKNWTHHDLKKIRPKTESQRMLMESFMNGNNVVASGYPGTGKTYLSLWLALHAILDNDSEYNKVVIVRSAVASREIGFLPGTKEEKMEPFEAPYKDILGDLIGRNAYEDMRDAGKLEFMPTSYLRGLTWDNCVVIIDEIQNLSWMEIHTVITRLGKNSKLLVCGDQSQNDLEGKRFEESGMGKFLQVAAHISRIDIVNFVKEDVVRSGFVKEWIIAKEDLNL